MDQRATYPWNVGDQVGLPIRTLDFIVHVV